MVSPCWNSNKDHKSMM